MSDDLHLEPDVVVRTALRLLPVPDHGERFWDDLDRLLDAEPLSASAAAPTRSREPGPAVVAPLEGPVAVELEADRARSVLPPAVRRRSNALAAIAAVAAAVLVVVASSALIRQRSGTDVGTADLAGTPTTPVPEAVPTSATTGPSATVSDDVADESSDAVLAWVSALGDGDADTAWDSLGPASQAHLGHPSALEGQMHALGEGYGAWSDATPEHVLVTPMASGLVVVTLVGDVEQEGVVERRADAFPVRVLDTGARVEPFDTAGTVELVAPHRTAGGGTPTVDDDEMVVVVPGGVEAPVIRLDDGTPLVCGQGPGTELTTIEGASGQRCAYTPSGGIPPGPRVLTVACVGADGTISAESVHFEAG